MQRVTYHLGQEQIEQLAALSAATGRPQAALIREALALYLPFVTPGSRAELVLIEAENAFEDAQGPSAALTRALFHWMYSRAENSKRGALDRILNELSEIKESLHALAGYSR